MTSRDAERDQSEVVALLADPATYGAEAPVERTDTHISHLFLVGSCVYKLKRAVRFPYVDFTTRAARQAACEAEVRVNRRTAPKLYLGVASVLRTDSGLRLAAPGEAARPGEQAVDWVVAMRRFDQASLFDSMARRDALTPELIAELAETVAAFHERAAPAAGFGGAKGMGYALDGIMSELRRFTPSVFEPDTTVAAERELRRTLAAVAPLLDVRAAAGSVRQAHGDLHLRNICLFEGRPTPFDAIEFNDAIANIDVLYDLAFLLMDLEHQRLRALANRALNDYLHRTADYGGLPAMPFFLACRAMIRAHVAATQDEGSTDPARRGPLATDARNYLRLGLDFLRPARPRLVAVGGLSGTGKTVLARALSPLFGIPPGAIHLRSDVIRKRLFGVQPLARLGPEAYTGAVTRRVYDTIRSQAADALRAGYAVVADAVYARTEERAGIAETARAAGAEFDGLWLAAPESVRVIRVQGRRGDASDADAAIVRDQSAFARDGVEWLRIDATGHPADTLTRVRKALKLNEKNQTLER